MGSFSVNPEPSGPRAEPNRPVKPRKIGFTYREIIAIDKGQILLEKNLDTGEVHSLSELPRLLQSLPSSILVANHFGSILQFLNKELADNDLWQFRASPIERDAYRPNRQGKKAVMKDCVIGYVGFKGRNKKKGHYHFPISPQTFVLKSIGDLRRNVPGELSTISKLMEWGREVRDFLDREQLRLSPTSGGIAAQLLRDKRFYPNDRRKVPRHTNAKAREHLPGNFYKLYEAKEGVYGEGLGIYRAAYLDQTSAHHSAAQKISFPCANSLYRKGRYNSLKDYSYARFGTEKYKSAISEYGLFYLAFECPLFFPNDFPLPECDKAAGYQRGYFYSNELDYLEKLGVRIRHIIAAWTSPDKDQGLNRYALWASERVANASRLEKNWLKPTLLSTYGVLAAKPKILEFGYRQAKNGEPKKYACGSGFIDVIAKSSSKMREPLMANVIHRGMVEAETRLRSLEFARELASEGHIILAIYADSIFVEGNKQLPLLKPPWRLQEFLTSLRFQSSTHFTSAQMSKTPGVPGYLRATGNLPPRPKSRKRIATQN